MLGMEQAMKTIYGVIAEAEQKEVDETPVEELLALRAKKPHLAKRIDTKLKGLPDEKVKSPDLETLNKFINSGFGAIIQDGDDDDNGIRDS